MCKYQWLVSSLFGTTDLIICTIFLKELTFCCKRRRKNVNSVFLQKRFCHWADFFLLCSQYSWPLVLSYRVYCNRKKTGLCFFSLNDSMETRLSIRKCQSFFLFLLSSPFIFFPLLVFYSVFHRFGQAKWSKSVKQTVQWVSRI